MCGQVGWAHYTAGLSTYTIDGEYLLGGWPGVGGLSVATGCNGSMLSAAGGVGRLIAAQVMQELGLPEGEGEGEGRDGLLEALGAARFAPARFEGDGWDRLCGAGEAGGGADVWSEGFRRRCAARRGAKFQPKEQA